MAVGPYPRTSAMRSKHRSAFFVSLALHFAPGCGGTRRAGDASIEGDGGPIGCGAWVELPDGEFSMGLDAPIPEWAVYDGGPPTCDTYLGGESPLHEVFVSTFRLAVNETTVQCYAECVGRGECEAPACDDLPPD